MKTIKYILIFAICGSLMGCGAKAQPQEWKPSRIAHAQGDGILYADTIDDLVSTMKVPEKLPVLKSKLERDDMGELVMPLSIKQRMEKMKAFIRKYNNIIKESVQSKVFKNGLDISDRKSVV